MRMIDSVPIISLGWRTQPVNATLLARIRARKVVCMTKIGRPGMSEASKAELWRRWKNGDSMCEIGRALEKEAASIRCVLAPHGGIMPRERYRSLVALSMIEREGISRGLSSGGSVRGIAASISRSPSTVSREKFAMEVAICIEPRMRTRTRKNWRAAKRFANFRASQGCARLWRGGYQ